jgi:hypothetical protein
MMDQGEDSCMLDKMGLATTLGGYLMCGLLIFLMFYLADPAYN